MRTTITESELQTIISESVKKNLSEALLKQRIKSLVRESIYDMGGYNQFEASDEDGRESDENNENKQQQMTRRNVIAFFKKKGVDHAPYAYRLYNVTAESGKDTNEMKNARGKFEKCLNGEPNENGYPYSFTSQEINQLKSMTSDNQL